MMRTIARLLHISLVTFAAICVSGCDRTADRLDVAASIVNERPDSAYAILRDVDYSDLDTDSLRAKYILTRAIANVRVGRSLITDTLLNDASAYYLSTGDTAKWVIASQLLSGYDLMRGESESALTRLEEMLPRISNPGLQWDTHIHLLETAFNSQDYEKAGSHADWLLSHTDVPGQILKFSTAKAASQYMQGNTGRAVAILDSVISSGAVGKVSADVSDDFYSDYAEMLDGAGHSSRAIAIIDSLNHNGNAINDVEKVNRIYSLAQFYANAGNTTKAAKLLDSINIDGTRDVFEVYASIAMLKAALQFRQTGRLPSELIHKVTKNMHRNYNLAQFNKQTAMESVIELNDDNYELRLQKQRLWLLVSGIVLVVIVSGVTVYFILSRRKQRMVEAEERAETLQRMLMETTQADEKDKECSSDSEKLKAALLRQLGIFKTFAGIPTQQSRDAIRRITASGRSGESIESLVDWQEFYSMIDSLYDGFHTKLIRKYPDLFNDKEQQIIVLLKAGFSTKEIGVLTEQSSATIYTRKSVIRKKLSTPENGDFIAQLDEQLD